MKKTKSTIIFPMINLTLSITHFILLIELLSENREISVLDLDLRKVSIIVNSILQFTSLILNTYLYAKYKENIDKKIFSFFCNQQRNLYISLVLLGDIIVSFFLIYEIEITWKLILGLIIIQLTRRLIYSGIKQILNINRSEPQCLEMQILEIINQA